jgi:hypothetical protein
LVNNRKCNPENAREFDVTNRIRFYCLIGHNEAEIYVMIEPDPHGTESGDDGHFHVGVSCENLSVAEIPSEPDRCRINGNTCQFTLPIGNLHRYCDQRKFHLSNKIIQGISSIEQYAKQIVNANLKSNLRKPHKLTVHNLTKALLDLGVIDDTCYKEIDALRNTRNKLAHDPKVFLDYAEHELYDLSKKIDEVVRYLHDKCFSDSKDELKG